MKNIIIDASIVLGYLIKSNKSAYKEFPFLLRKAINKKIKLLSLSFLPLEVANGLRFSKTNNEAAVKILGKFIKLPIKLINLSNDLLLQSTEYAYQNKTTVYDTAYHLLAISRNSVLLTCDKQYYSAAEKLEHIRLLSA